MPKALVVVESPSKVKSIQKYLGKDFEVKASKGHLVDLPKSNLGVDVENNFEPGYEITKPAVLTELKKAFKDKDTLVLAVDPDREGEAIGWHIAQKLGVIDKNGKVKKDKKLERIVFTSITKSAVEEAIKHPRGLDQNLFNAQQARRILDRLVGYKLSPLLWKKIRFGLSAGRVQSVAVKLIVEREMERNKFVPEEYWNVNGDLSQKSLSKAPQIVIRKKDKEDKSEIKNENSTDENILNFTLSKIDGKAPKLKTESEVQTILSECKDKEWKISNIESRESKRSPKPPFTTSTLQQIASNWFGFSAKRTMMVAQKLYEAGIITYMRTDSTNFSPDAVSSAREVITKLYGKNNIPEKPNYYRTKAKVAQEAHEAIRPANFTITPDASKLDGDEFKIYNLIWQRAVASQMVEAKIQNTKAEININKYTFGTNGQSVLSKGYLAVYPEKISENVLPKLEVGQILFLDKLTGNQSFTEPPARYSEATLIKTLESYGIGRPSTYVPIISTIQARGYVVKDSKYFSPTDTGIIVTRLLTDNFENIVDYEFTANIENSLDNIANGEVDWVKMMSDFYLPFEKEIIAKDKTIDRQEYTVLEEAPEEIKCPDCGGKMLVKLGRFGKFYSCKNWPECKGILSLDGQTTEQIEAEAKSPEFLAKYQGAPKTDDGRDFLLKNGRFGKFWAHPDYPKVKDARPLEYTDELRLKVYGETPIAKDGTQMLLKKGRFGEFWAHSDYPKTKEVVRINKKELAEKKQELGL